MKGIARSRLANWRTATKLAVGFGLVLLLTLVVALQGGLALKGVEHRFGLLRDMAAVNRQVTQVRALEQSFWLTGDTVLAEQVQQTLPAVLDVLGRLAAKVDDTRAADIAAAQGHQDLWRGLRRFRTPHHCAALGHGGRDLSGGGGGQQLGYPSVGITG